MNSQTPSETATSGLRVEVAITDPGACPIATTAAETDTSITNVSRGSVPDQSGRIAEEFTLVSPEEPEASNLTRVAAYNDRSVYRFYRQEDYGCVCESIERHGYPVADVQARKGSLHVSFHVQDLDAVETIIETLQEQFDGVQLQSLTRSCDEARNDLVFVDRSQLTDRQLQVIETAFELGYFDYPKEANAGDVADELGISPSTFSEHLAAAQRKLFATLVDDKA